MICRLCGEPFMFGDSQEQIRRVELLQDPKTGQTICRPLLHEDGTPIIRVHYHCLAEKSMSLIGAEGGRVDG